MSRAPRVTYSLRVIPDAWGLPLVRRTYRYDDPTIAHAAVHYVCDVRRPSGERLSFELPLGGIEPLQTYQVEPVATHVHGRGVEVYQPTVPGADPVHFVLPGASWSWVDVGPVGLSLPRIEVVGRDGTTLSVLVDHPATVKRLRGEPRYRVRYLGRTYELVALPPTALGATHVLRLGTHLVRPPV